MIKIAKLLRYNGTFNETTDEFETGAVTNVERDSKDQITIYFECCTWYLTLSQEDWEKV